MAVVAASSKPSPATARTAPLSRKTAFGMWNGGRYLNFGAKLSEEDLVEALLHAYQKGIRNFVTADVYGCGEADRLLGQALAEIPRETYAIFGAVGHDFTRGTREGQKGYPRFTDPKLRGREEYEDYLHIAVQDTLERLGTDY